MHCPTRARRRAGTATAKTRTSSFPGRPRRRFLNWGTAVLLALAVGGIGFYVGVRVEKGQVSDSSSGSSASPFAALAGRAAGPKRGRRRDAATRRRGGCGGRGRRWPRRVCRGVRWRQQLVWDGLERQRQDHLRDAGRHWERRQGHALERDQDHQERGRREVSDPARRHRRRLGRQGVDGKIAATSVSDTGASATGSGTGSGSSSGGSSGSASSAVSSLFGGGGGK